MSSASTPLRQRRRVLRSLCAAAALGLPGMGWARNNAAQRAFTLLVPSGAGSLPAIASAAVSAKLADFLTYPVRRIDAADTGIVAHTQALSRATPNGDTAGMIDPSHLLMNHAHASVPFDLDKDFTMVSILGGAPLLLVANPARVQAGTLPELITLLKAEPGSYRYGAPGQGNVLQLAIDLFLKQTGLTPNAVATPVSGEGAVLEALADQRLDFGIVTLPGAQPYLAAKGLRVLGVCSGMRLMTLPGVPTLREQGLLQYELESWFALIAPAGLSFAQASTLYSAFRRVLSVTATRQVLEAQGITLIMMPPEQSALIVQSEAKKFGQLARKAGWTPA